MSQAPPPPGGGTPPPPPGGTPPPPGGPLPPAPPPPVAFPPPGETPPPGGPRGGNPALLAALIGFGVVVVVGLLLFFLVLKPSPTPGPGPVTSPSSQPSTPPSSPPPSSQPPTAPPSSQPPSSPPGSSAPPSQPPNNGGQNASFTIAFCQDRGGPQKCTGLGDHPGPGKWVLPASAGKFVVWLGSTGTAQGDTVEIDLLDPNSGQALVDPATFTLTGTPNCTVQNTKETCLTFRITTSNGGPFQSGFQVEAQVKYNGQLLDFGHPEILTLK